MFGLRGIEGQRVVRGEKAAGLSAVSLQAALRNAGLSSPSFVQEGASESLSDASSPFTGADGTGSGMGTISTISGAPSYTSTTTFGS